jgi:hypothetical protein
MKRTEGIEVADVFRRYGEQYRSNHRLPTEKLKVMKAVETCRTSALGGYVEQCEACGHQRTVFHSCRNRHCPKCGTGVREKWLYSRRAELLPIVYYHVVFTLPEELNAVALINQEIVYELLSRQYSVGPV